MRAKRKETNHLMDAAFPERQVAETNRETHMVEYLTNRAAGSGKDGAELKTSDEIPDSEKYL